MNIIDDLFARHDRVGLLISGGKDSLSCFHLCRPYWDRLTLVWVDTGRNLPEVVRVIEDCASKVWRVNRLVSDQRRFVASHGYPSDLVVSDSTATGQLVTTPHRLDVGVRVCDKWECCRANIWEPIRQWMETTDCTAVIKGQKECDGYVGPSYSLPHVRKDGTEIEMCLPVFNWTDEDCRKFLKGKANPELLSLAHSSFDCWDCTGYWRGLPGRLEYLKAHHPDKAKHVIWLFKEMRKDMARAEAVLDEHMEKLNG